MADITALDVLLHGVAVGTLTRVQGDRTLFTFRDEYISDGNRAVLGLGFKDQFGKLMTEFPSYQTRVMPFFSNLLPEGRMRTYLAQRAGIDSKREFFLLWALGRDLPGAITIRASDGDDWPQQADEEGPERRDHHDQALRFSLAGVQLKFSVLGEMRSGLGIPAKGIGGAWIIKLPSLEFEGVPENEYSMMTLARLLGMDVPALDLVDLDAIDNLPEGFGRLKGQALVIERFDRLSNGRGEHIEDFAQVFGVYPEAKYNKGSTRSIARVIGAEGTLNDIREFVRRLTFNTLIGNGDMHLKNWSLIYPDQRRAALAPAYDFVSTIAYLPYDRAALKVSRTKRFDEFTDDELVHLAAKARLPEKLVLDTARETAALFHQHWEAEKNHLPLMRNVMDAIDSHIKTIPMA